MVWLFCNRCCRMQTREFPCFSQSTCGKSRVQNAVFAGLFVGLLGLACSMEESAAADSPNILLIAVDDLRPSLGCYGDQHGMTPNIDRLAARGRVFSRACCQVAVCNPSRASLMTGLRPDTLGVWTLPIHFREAKPDAVTRPQWLRRFGYTAVSHGRILHNPRPDPQSWSEPIRAATKVAKGYPQGWRDEVRQARNQLADNDWRKRVYEGPPRQLRKLLTAV